MSTPRVVPDPAVIAHVVAGSQDRLIPRERAEVVRQLTARGRSAAVIARHLNVTPRTVTRIRAQLASAGG